MASKFKYDTLPKNHMRLMRFCACSDTLFQCEIKDVDVNTDLHWYALSYVWGKQTADQKILLNEQEFLVTPNLLAALKAIHKNVNPGDDIWIWVDAICIDQSNGDEKSVQVPHMGTVYSQASVVMIWFGEIPARLQIVIKVLEALDRIMFIKALMGEKSLNYFRDIHVSLKSKGHPEINFWAEDVLRMYKECLCDLEEVHGMTQAQLACFEFLIQKYDTIKISDAKYCRGIVERVFHYSHSFWPALFSFLDNDWFHRVWTFQESVLAR